MHRATGIFGRSHALVTLKDSIALNHNASMKLAMTYGTYFGLGGLA
jgi:hypothetical protein